jgi:hypothetical protein
MSLLHSMAKKTQSSETAGEARVRFATVLPFGEEIARRRRSAAVMAK